jgi:proteasome lid subunit RPN8/RPN11
MSDRDVELFSLGYQSEDPANWGSDIVEAFDQLISVVGEVRCVRWNSDHVAAAFSVPVDLPSRGPVGGLDIRPSEAILLVFSRRDYPERAPMARSDRKDFPVGSLPHLNPVAPGQPPWFCLHRGNFDDWFAEHTIADLVTRVRGWLRDAASNRLIRDNDFFEPTRLSESVGTVVFSEKSFQDWMAMGWKSTHGKAGYGFLAMSLLDAENYQEVRDGAFPVKARQFYAKEEDLSRRLKAALAIKEIAAGDKSIAPWCFGILAWTGHEQSVREYFGCLPRKARELLDFCGKLGIPLPEALRDYAGRNLAVLKGVPIILAIPRQQKILNSMLSIEPLCFVADGSSDEFSQVGSFPEDALSYSLAHRSPLTPEAAKAISGLANHENPGRILLLGSGALGSKIALHFGRAGHTAITPVDFDSLAPHNLVRHALLSEHIGQNKAEGLVRSIDSIFENVPEASAPLYDKVSALDWLKGDRRSGLEQHELLIDATASGMVFEALIRSDLPTQLKVARAGIADLGKLGILMIEGRQRNPRVDDLNVLLTDMAVDHFPIRQWLQREKEQLEEGVGAIFEAISIGMSCASDTMRLADDVVSWHASTFSLALRELPRTPNHGFLVLNYTSEANGSEALVSERIKAIPVVVASALCLKGWQMRGRAAWQVRIAAHVVRDMHRRLKAAAPRETGGLMVGLIHPKRRIIYVTRLVVAPADSEASSAWFKRGTFKLPESISEIRKASGDLLGYIGDWHTHPRGSGRISETDVKAMMKTKRKFDTAGLPTFILIVSHKGLHPYVADAN